MTKGASEEMVSRLRVLVVLMALAIAAFSATPTFAARGGGGHGTTTTATLSVWQNGAQVTSVPAGSTVDLKCAGLPANSTVYVGIMNTVGTRSVVTDGSGSCSVSWGIGYAGSYNFFVGTMNNKGFSIRATALVAAY
jgi:hypothetical protein